MPGTLPVMNREAVECAIKLGLALGSHIAPESILPAKLLLPDLPKGYQISQFEIPVVQGGEVSFFLGDEKKDRAPGARPPGRRRRQIAARRLHWPKRHRPEPRRHAAAGDRDRARHPQQRRGRGAYAKELHKIVTWIGICDGNMQEGSFRCDANVSVRKPGAPLGTRREIRT